MFERNNLNKKARLQDVHYIVMIKADKAVISAINAFLFEQLIHFVFADTFSTPNSNPISISAFPLHKVPLSVSCVMRKMKMAVLKQMPLNFHFDVPKQTRAKSMVRHRKSQRFPTKTKLN